MLLDLTPAANRQPDLLMPRNEEKQETIMQALDKLNHKYGEHTVFYAVAGMNEKLKRVRQFKSPHYTTQWDELPKKRPSEIKEKLRI